MKAKSHWQWIAVAALLSFVVGISFFCPRYVLWRGLEIPQAQIHPEVNRATFRLQQIERPFAPSENLTHWPLRWRILLPLLAYYLHLPPKVFFALPFAGCFLVLGLIAHIVLRETESALLALLSSMLAATTSWFFVSTGWLGYFDAWYVLGLLCVAGIRSRMVLVGSCLLLPWVDERFIVAFPLAFAMRAAVFNWMKNAEFTRLFKEGALAGCLIAPYVLFRLGLLVAGQDASSTGHLEYHFSMFAGHHREYIIGIWHGLRAGWVLVLVCMVLAYGRAGVSYKIAATAIAATILLANHVVALDFSRSASVLMPCVLVGILLVARQRLQWAVGITFVALLVNLALPARHVVATFTIDINNVLRERERASKLPDTVNPIYYNHEGVALFNRDNYREAESHYNVALDLLRAHPQSVDDPYLLADVYWNRAILFVRSEKWPQALSDLENALKSAPEGWQQRALAEQYLADINRQYQPNLQRSD